MKINKYLEELGFKQHDLPGYFNEELIGNEEYDGCAGADPRNEENEEGFCSYEFFSLDWTLSLFIYSKLCYFRDHIAPIATPGCLTGDFSSRGDLTEKEQEIASKAAHDKWISIVNKMCDAFKIKIKGRRCGYEGIDREKEREGLQLFIEYYDCLWY